MIDIDPLRNLIEWGSILGFLVMLIIFLPKILESSDKGVPCQPGKEEPNEPTELG